MFCCFDSTHVVVATYCEMQIALDYIGIIICVVIGLILSIVFFIGCCFFGLARLCGGCCGSIKKKPQQKSDSTKRTVLEVVLFLLIVAIA